MSKLKPDPDAKRRNRVSVSISRDHGAIADRLRDGTGKSRAEVVEIALELAEKYGIGGNMYIIPVRVRLSIPPEIS